MSRSWQIPLSENRKFQGCLGRSGTQADKIRLLKPLTYMNRSGQAIRAATDWFKLPPQVGAGDMTIWICDWGRIRLRLSGSAGDTMA